MQAIRYKRGVLMTVGGAAPHDTCAPAPPVVPVKPQPTPPCSDTPPPGQYTCAQQKSWGKCSADFMRGFCCKTCWGCAGVLQCGGPAPASALPLKHDDHEGENENDKAAGSVDKTESAAATAGTVTVSLVAGSFRALPLMGFGTELVWQSASDSVLAAAASKAGSRVVRYPGGTPSNFWDWACEHEACCEAKRAHCSQFSV